MINSDEYSISAQFMNINIMYFLFVCTYIATLWIKYLCLLNLTKFCYLYAAASSSICPESGSGPLYIPLAKRDVRDIANELSSVAYNWPVVGTCLGVDDSEIKEIETQRLLPKRALIELITRWLSTYHNVTWNDIVRALRMPLLKEESLAKKIEEKALSRTCESHES